MGEVQHQMDTWRLRHTADEPAPAAKPIRHGAHVAAAAAIGDDAEFGLAPDLEPELAHPPLDRLARGEHAAGDLEIALLPEVVHDRPGGRDGSARAGSDERLRRILA